MDEARISKVELFEDRAAVTRTLYVEPGRTTLRIGPISHLVDAKRVTTPRSPGDASWVLEDVQVRYEHRSNDAVDSERVAAIRNEVEAAVRMFHEAKDHSKRAEGSERRIMQMLEAAAGATSSALQEGEPASTWIDAMRELAARAEARAAETANAVHKSQQCKQEVQRLKTALEAALVGKSVHEATLVLQIHAQSAGPIQVRTVIPCALWRPAHRATLDTQTGQVHWEVRAACWNVTGEDWSDVPLVCSTARPGQRADPPTLTDDRVQAVPRSTDIVVEAREEIIAQARASAQQIDTLPGVDDGGEARVYNVEEPISLASDGLPVFVTLERFSMPAESDWRAIPLVGGHAVLRSVQTNPCARPLLAGPVDLNRDGVQVGRGSIQLVPSGERFELGWGNHDGLRIVRKQEHDVERAMLTGTHTHTFKVEIRVSHLGAEPVVLRIDERIPVSELKQVSVALGDCSPSLTQAPDTDGLCRWRIELQPRQTHTFRMDYTVVASSKIQLPF